VRLAHSSRHIPSLVTDAMETRQGTRLHAARERATLRNGGMSQAAFIPSKRAVAASPPASTLSQSLHDVATTSRARRKATLASSDNSVCASANITSLRSAFTATQANNAGATSSSHAHRKVLWNGWNPDRDDAAVPADFLTRYTPPLGESVCVARTMSTHR
jgi:hypothetical protein